MYDVIPIAQTVANTAWTRESQPMLLNNWRKTPAHSEIGCWAKKVFSFIQEEIWWMKVQWAHYVKRKISSLKPGHPPLSIIMKVISWGHTVLSSFKMSFMGPLHNKLLENAENGSPQERAVTHKKKENATWMRKVIIHNERKWHCLPLNSLFSLQGMIFFRISY